jgi:hypothetical protein
MELRQKMRVLVFGDSITQGYWDTDGGWVDRIRRHFDTIQATDLQDNDEPTIFNLGISADNSRNILERIETETISRTRHGLDPEVDSQGWVDIKSLFYADSRMLSEAALEVFIGL